MVRCIIAFFQDVLTEVFFDAFDRPMRRLGFLSSPFCGLRCLFIAGVFCVYRRGEVTMVNLALLFPCGGLFDTWLPFGEVFLDLLVNPRVQCEADYS